MHRSLYLVLIFLLSILLFSCRSGRQVFTSTGGEPNAAAYVDRYKDIAVNEMRRSGVPASITLAQGMVESDFGRSTLARNSNNHFGIKCHNGWTGPTVRHDDDRRNECFRKYRSPEESFYDHSEFLRTGSRYRFLFELSPGDYKGWARGLKKAGYATNPHYADMLIRKIEENNLHFYDHGYTTQAKTSVTPPAVQTVSDTTAPVAVMPEPSAPVMSKDFAVTARVPRLMENNRIQYIIVKDGETSQSIEKEFSLLRWELARYNELGNDYILTPGQILYLQPKRNRAEAGKDTHNVAEGETMYLISQLYGVRVSKLYEYNRMEEGGEPQPGTKVWLRNMKPFN